MQNASPLHWDIQSEDCHTHIYIKGELSRFTLLPLWQVYAPKKGQCFSQDLPIIWHFGDIYHLDSAGFALLCDLLHQGENAPSQRIADCSQQFLTLTDLFGLTPWVKGFLTNNN